jgi:hypothetical protein
MPVQFVDKKGFKRLRFNRNTSHNGKEYGPDYPDQECDVENQSAFHYLAQGRAVEVKEKPAPSLPGSSDVQVRDPVSEHRDPVLPSGGQRRGK